eukprot:TRINITY_DN3568_c0_g1_i11.p1 TRINITY_DN3568_c0_g1~~TRINITY_DN3568_c0_g1_i11.p1  ORF type:complete len:106 (+),score=11.37 TRINITY_DN3568_c0_g1_i11:265-582(+)
MNTWRAVVSYVGQLNDAQQTQHHLSIEGMPPSRGVQMKRKPPTTDKDGDRRQRAPLACTATRAHLCERQLEDKCSKSSLHRCCVRCEILMRTRQSDDQTKAALCE